MDLDKSFVNDYIDLRRKANVKEGKIFTELKDLSPVINHAIENEKTDAKNYILWGKKKVEDYKPNKNTWSEDESKLILDTLQNSNPCAARMLKVWRYTGIRSKELTKLELSDFIIREGYAFLLLRETKNGKDREVPLLPEALEAVNEAIEYKKQQIKKGLWPDNDYIFPRPDGEQYKTSPRRTINTAMKNAGVDKKGLIHIWRHTFATEQYYNDKSENAISDTLGHSSVELTKKVYISKNSIKLAEKMGCKKIDEIKNCKEIDKTNKIESKINSENQNCQNIVKFSDIVKNKNSSID